jgi:DnaK suppressor protein
MKRFEFLKQTERRLQVRREALRRALAGDAGMLESLHETGVGDEVDAAVTGEHTELRSQIASYESRELAQIERALEKIREGTYGRCEVCERAIAPLRLKALPYATECIECARREERRGAPARGYLPVNRIAALKSDEKEPELDETYEEIG